MTTSPGSEKGIFPSDPDFPNILNDFSKMKSPESFPRGRYAGRFLKFYANPALKLAISFLWVGSDFYDAGRCRTLVRPPVNHFSAKDEGEVRLNQPSVYDGLPCMRVDFSDRFYETRARGGEKNELFTIVTFKKNKWISDVNILSPMASS